MNVASDLVSEKEFCSLQQLWSSWFCRESGGFSVNCSFKKKKSAVLETGCYGEKGNEWGASQSPGEIFQYLK